MVVLLLVDAAVQDITTLVNSYLTLTIPAVIGMLTGILSIVNHYRNSSKISNLQLKVGEAGGKIETAIQQNIGKIDTGIDLASRLSPAFKQAIVDNNPKVLELQAQQLALQKKLDELNAYIKTLQPSSPSPTPTQ